MITKIKDFLAFSRSEQRGIIVLLIIIFLLMIINRSISHWKPFHPDDFENFKNEIDVFMLEQQRLRDSADSARRAKFTLKRNIHYPKQKETAFKPVEINCADSAKLIKLRGIGPVFAGRIMKYRNLLGGYYKKEQLLEVYDMDSGRFANIRDHVFVDTTLIKKINLNTAEFRYLLKHPYFDYTAVKAIFNYKRENGRINSADQLLEIEEITTENFHKFKPYISISH